MRWICGTALVLLLAGCGGSARTGAGDESAADTFEVAGSLTLVDREGIDESVWQGPARVGDECAGGGGYSDLTGGTQVTVTNASGKTIALGELQPGEMTIGIMNMRGGGSADGVTNGCAFAFDITDVPADGDIYSITVGSRAPINFTRDEASSLEFSIG